MYTIIFLSMVLWNFVYTNAVHNKQKYAGFHLYTIGKNGIYLGDYFTVNPRLMKAVQLKAGGMQYKGFSSM